MLVLARQLNERILMPTVRATIEVVAIKPGSVRLGIDAPPEITILREEVFRRGGAPPGGLLVPADLEAETRLAGIKHVLRNRLHTVALGLDLLRQQLQASPVPGLEAMLRRMEEEVRALDRQLKALLADPLDELPTPTAIVQSIPAAANPASCLEVAEGGLAI